MAITDFSAKEPSLGYYYQIRLSLYLLLSNNSTNNPTIAIESLDDIVIEETDKTDLYQTKLHLNNPPDLTDASPDLWKTIRIWSENITHGRISASNTIFSLITTAKINESSTLSCLKFNRGTEKRDCDTILDKLVQITTTSSNKINLPAYKAFTNLSHENQLLLIKNIQIIDSSISIDETLNEIKNILKFSAPVGKIDLFTQYLEGWWFQQCIEMLLAKIKSISNTQLTQKISDIRDTFQIDNLPDDFGDPITIQEDELPDYEDRLFIRQLKIIAIKSNLLRNAISDFRRAYEQRSKWLREDLASLEEFEVFESQLYDNWHNIFMALKDDCEGVGPDEMRRLGENFYRKYYVERVPNIRIRPRFSSEYLTRGSCHILADKKIIGWHPNFENLL